MPRQDAREINADSKTNDCRYTGSRGKVFAEEQGEGIAEEGSCVVTSRWSALRANDGHIVRLYRFAWLLARGLIMIARVIVRPSVYHPCSVCLQSPVRQPHSGASLSSPDSPIPAPISSSDSPLCSSITSSSLFHFRARLKT